MDLIRETAEKQAETDGVQLAEGETMDDYIGHVVRAIVFSVGGKLPGVM